MSLTKSSSLCFKRKEGQTLVEFAFVSVIFIFLLVLTYNGIIAFSVQQYLSYVTFMSARAYQSGGETIAEQRTSAERAMQALIPGLPDPNSITGGGDFILRFPLFNRKVAKIENIFISAPDTAALRPTNSPAGIRVRIDYKVPFAIIPIGQEIIEKFGEISMSSESRLGRQVTRAECYGFFKTFLSVHQIRAITQSDAQRKHQLFIQRYPRYMDDNGC